MFTKRHEQKVTINDMRRANKKRSDSLKREADRASLQNVFNTYYREQVSALYKAVRGQ